MLTLPGKRVQRAVSFIALILVASWCVLRGSVYVGIIGYYSTDPSGSGIVRNAQIHALTYLCFCCLAIAAAAWVNSRIIGDFLSDVVPTVKYASSALLAILAVCGIVAVASIVIKHL